MAIDNKLGITSSPELAEAEERISKKKAILLFEGGIFEVKECLCLTFQISPEETL